MAEKWLERTSLLLGDEKLERLRNANVLVVGLGGVGAYAAEMIARAGLPIKEFFIWGDDIEYTRRLSMRMKLPCYLVGKSRVIHAMKENNGSSIATDVPERIGRYNFAFRNENYLYRKEGICGFVFYTEKCALNLLRILRFAKDHRLKRCWVIIRQYVSGLFFNPKIEYTSAEERS